MGNPRETPHSDINHLSIVRDGTPIPINLRTKISKCPQIVDPVTHLPLIHNRTYFEARIAAQRKTQALLRGVDSGNGSKDIWGDTNSSIESYDHSFEGVLHNDETIADILSTMQSPLVVDLMAPTHTLADLFNKTPHIPNKRGIAVGLIDHRNEDEIERDRNLGITFVPGDITNQTTRSILANTLADQYADLILVAGKGGNSLLPEHRLFNYESLQYLWDMANPNGGQIFVQVNTDLTVFSNENQLVSIVNRHLNEEGIESERHIGYGFSTLRIKKMPDSPKFLFDH